MHTSLRESSGSSDKPYPCCGHVAFGIDARSPRAKPLQASHKSFLRNESTSTIPFNFVSQFVTSLPFDLADQSSKVDTSQAE